MKIFIFAFSLCLFGVTTPAPVFDSQCRNNIPDIVCAYLNATDMCQFEDIQSSCPQKCEACNGTRSHSDALLPTIDPSVCKDRLAQFACLELKLEEKCGTCVVQAYCPGICDACAGNLSCTILGETLTTTTLTPETEKPCVDQSPMCGSLAGNCGSDPLMGKVCPETCGLCPTTTTTTTTTATTTTTTTTPSPDEPCSDKSELCASFSSACGSDDIVQNLCPETCGLCPTTTTTTTTPPPQTCADKSPSCAAFVSACGSDPVVDNLCPATCGKCPTTTTPRPTGPPRMCHQCGSVSGSACTSYELLLGTATLCRAGLSYCMTDIWIVDGKRHVVKRCTDQPTCNNDWLNSSADKSECVQYDPSDMSVDTLDCHYCCTKDNCNSGLKPDIDTLYHLSTV